jgi:hypothetical protein
MLADEGYRPTLDEDGDLVFKVEGESYILWSDPNDEDYMRFVTMYLLDDETDANRALALASFMNYRMKAVKFTVLGGGKSAAFSIEAFYGESEHFRPFISRVLKALKAGSDEYFAKLRSGEPLDEIE